MMMAAPNQVWASGRVCQISQSSATPQARAVYSNGATALACPLRKASLMVSWPRKPVTASASSSAAWSICTGFHWDQASRPPPTLMKIIMVRISDSVLSVRLSRRPATAATA